MNAAVGTRPSAAGGARQRLRAAWDGLAPRERRLVALAAALIGGALLWLVAVQPAWRTLARAPAELEKLELQTQAMQQLAAEVSELKGAPPVPVAAAQQALRAATERLGPSAQITFAGERVVLRVDGVAPGALRAWLAEARAGARARPVAAALTRRGPGLAGSVELALGAGGG